MHNEPYFEKYHISSTVIVVHSFSSNCCIGTRALKCFRIERYKIMIRLISLIILLCYSVEAFHNYTEVSTRRLSSTTGCDSSKVNHAGYEKYFKGMDSIHRGKEEGTCLPVHKGCGWQKPPSGKTSVKNNLPTFVLSVGLEGAGHHMYVDNCVIYAISR